MKLTKEIKKDLKHFLSIYDENHESKAIASRGEFVSNFPIKTLKNLTLDDYVTGKGTSSFCNSVEAKSVAWAKIQGSTSIKFGVYYGKKKPETEKKYRFAKKFGGNVQEAFSSVKGSLESLIKDAKKKSFLEVDQNPLSQMFKAKIISLYFPELYINICSKDHIKELALILGHPDTLPISQYQNLLLDEKNSNSITGDWSNPKFMSFLYMKYIRKNLYSSLNASIKKPRKKSRRKVNFEELQKNKDMIGKISEEYALEWEKNRLIGLGLNNLAKKIKDRTDIPSYGYDFLSYDAKGRERQIEVKSLGGKKDLDNESYRFFLSENEKGVSLEYDESYYFYMVQFGKDMKPIDIHIKKASELYQVAEVVPCAYKVRFSLDK